MYSKMGVVAGMDPIRDLSAPVVDLSNVVHIVILTNSDMPMPAFQTLFSLSRFLHI